MICEDSMQLNLFNNLPAEGESKVCAKCQELKPMASYRLYRRATGDRNSRDSKCKDCSRHSNEVIARLRKVAPKPTGVCECCGKEPERLVLDHCHDKEVFRGWLCPPCNLGIGLLGDNMQGIERVIAYLQKP
tara:strand:+ start:1050 stop:1445 length:396 start_codon:yes stop_codon:yes gene_type:complete